MSFMSVPALDRLLEPSESDGASWRGKGGGERRAVMSSFFPSSQAQDKQAQGQGQGQASPSPPPAPFSPSPFVLNFKRRVFDGGEATARGAERDAPGLNEDGMLPVREVRGEKAKAVEQGTWRRPTSRNPARGQQDFDLFSMSASNREEFFDAPEDPFDDIASDEESLRAQRTPRSIPGSRRDVDGPLKSLLDQEIKRRMAAEDAMAVLQLQCTEMASHLAASVDDEGRGLDDSGSQAQKLVVAQVVAFSVARGAARAEVDEEMETVVAEKNREIARLRDKLRYYELVNHEMSQRNQEAFELARSRRHTRRNRNQWLMVFAGSALCVGVSAILVSKFAPWATSHFPSKSVLQSHLRTDVQHSSPSSHDI